jgi:hypothetical protein
MTSRRACSGISGIVCEEPLKGGHDVTALEIGVISCGPPSPRRSGWRSSHGRFRKAVQGQNPRIERSRDRKDGRRWARLGRRRWRRATPRRCAAAPLQSSGASVDPARAASIALTRGGAPPISNAGPVSAKTGSLHAFFALFVVAHALKLGRTFLRSVARAGEMSGACWKGRKCSAP